jgi:hypothetical protein
VVRTAGRKDLDRLAELGWQAHAASNNKHLPISEEKWRKTIEAMMLRPWENVVLISDDGFLLGTLAEYPYAEGRYAIDVAFFASGSGRGLLREFEKWARAKKALEIVIVNSFGQDRTDKFLAAMGMNMVGGMHVKPLGDKHE